MDRTIQLEKKYSSEFSSTENTVEVIVINSDNGPFEHCSLSHYSGA